MKKRFLIPVFLCACTAVFAQPQVIFNFVSHNEETTQWNGPAFYVNNRAKIISLANDFQSKGITWNLQSDWVYLTNVLTQETPALMTATNGKNILRWMHEDKGVEMDPHAHESQYLYPDVVKLMDSIGLPESKLMGGTIYNDHNGLNIWTNLVDGQYGMIFPDKFWRPDYMMGGGTPNHVDDLKYYGFWNPQSPSNYLTHDSNSRLRHMGLGCEMKIQSTTEIAEVMTDIRALIANVQQGLYPSSGIYVQSIFFEQGDLNNVAFYNKLVQVADSVNALVTSGAAQWKTLKQAYSFWEIQQDAQVFQWECGQLVDSTEPVGDQAEVYPNPFQGHLAVKNAEPGSRFFLCNTLGQRIWCGTNIDQEDFSAIPAGVYWLEIQAPGSRRGDGRMVVKN